MNDSPKYSIEQYKALKDAIASGTYSVSYGDKQVTYRSIEDMRLLLAIMEDELFPERKMRRRHFASMDKGYFKRNGK